MNVNEEGKYYASMVRKFRTEYKGKDLPGFCRNHQLSYTKMLHCLRSDSYRKPKATVAESIPEQGLHPLVIDPVASPAVHPTGGEHVPSPADMLLDDIDVSFGARVSLHIGRCSRSALVSLIKEMEGALC